MLQCGQERMLGSCLCSSKNDFLAQSFFRLFVCPRVPLEVLLFP